MTDPDAAKKLAQDIALLSNGTLRPKVQDSSISLSGYEVLKLQSLFPNIKLPELPEQPDLKRLRDFGLNVDRLLSSKTPDDR